ncbi:hypothetical protein PFISCL1PPCAC_24807, partial [Pristionchus fissidentatus]
QFDADISNPKELFEEVDGRTHPIDCPKDWQLFYKSSSEYTQIKSIDCVKENKKFHYIVTSLDDKKTPMDTPFFARCAQERCLSCSAVSCDSGDCVPPTWTPGEEQSCAKLTCDPARFEVKSNDKWLPFEEEPKCHDGDWSMNGGKTKFAVARCVNLTSCLPLGCRGCSDSVDSAACSNPEMQMTDSSGNSTGSVICDSTRGRWISAGTKKDVNSSALTCARKLTAVVSPPSTGRSAMLALGWTLVVAGVLGNVIGCVIWWRVTVLRRISSAPSKPIETGHSTKNQATVTSTSLQDQTSTQ